MESKSSQGATSISAAAAERRQKKRSGNNKNAAPQHKQQQRQKHQDVFRQVDNTNYNNRGNTDITRGSNGSGNLTNRLNLRNSSNNSKRNHSSRPPLVNKPIKRTNSTTSSPSTSSTTNNHNSTTNNNNNKTTHLQKQYNKHTTRLNSTLILLLTTALTFILTLLFTLSIQALLSLTFMITTFGLFIILCISTIKARYYLELYSHPFGLLRFLPRGVRGMLVERSLHDCLISPSESFGSLKSLGSKTSFGGDDGSGSRSRSSSKNSLCSLLLSTKNSSKNSLTKNSSKNSLVSCNNNNNNNSSSSIASMNQRIPSRNSLPIDIRSSRSNEDELFTSGGFDMMQRQSTLRRNNCVTSDEQFQKKEQKKQEELKSDRYSIYQTNPNVIR